MIKLKKPDLNLADYLIENEIGVLSKSEYEEYKNAKAFGNMPMYAIVHAFLYGDPVDIVYFNDGQCFFEENDIIEDYLLDDPEFWFFDKPDEVHDAQIEGEEIVFSDDEDAIEWEGRYDDEAICNAFKLNNRNSPFASFVGIFYDEEGGIIADEGRKALDSVLTVSEAAELFKIDVSTIRKACITGRFMPYECRKSGSTWLVTRDGMNRVFRRC